MKNIQFKLYITSLLAAALLIAGQANSQTRKLPDGTIVYPDGTKRLPNGTIIYKDGANNYPNDRRNDRGAVTLPDGRVVYPDGGVIYPDDRYPDGRYPDDRYPNKERRKYKKHGHRDNGQWLPPGQAKKIYGGSAKDYAHGQKKWKKHGKKH